MPKPVCVPCGRFYRPKRNGVAVFENRPIENGAKPGKINPDKWTDYLLWQGDHWRCEGCGAEIVVGFGHHPITEHYKPEWKEMKEKLLHEAATAGRTVLVVNDC